MGSSGCLSFRWKIRRRERRTSFDRRPINARTGSPSSAEACFCLSRKVRKRSSWHGHQTSCASCACLLRLVGRVIDSSEMVAGDSVAAVDTARCDRVSLRSLGSTGSGRAEVKRLRAADFPRSTDVDGAARAADFRAGIPRRAGQRRRHQRERASASAVSETRRRAAMCAGEAATGMDYGLLSVEDASSCCADGTRNGDRWFRDARGRPGNARSRRYAPSTNSFPRGEATAS